MNGDRTPLNMEENLESSGSYNSLPDETRRPGQLERAFRRRTVRDVLSLVDDLDAKAEFAPGPFVADAEAPATSHRGAAYLTYCDAFRRLQERCRADAAR